MESTVNAASTISRPMSRRRCRGTRRRSFARPTHCSRATAASSTTRSDCPIEIVRWPAAGRRPVDPDTGDQGGTVVGKFAFWWDGDTMFGRNTAVGDQYLLGWSRNPVDARRTGDRPRRATGCCSGMRTTIPTAASCSFPRNGEPFVTALALPGDDVTPEDFITFYVDGGRGLYLHPNVWHEAVFPLVTPSRFHDEQGRVHARVSVNFAAEFGVFLSMPMRAP